MKRLIKCVSLFLLIIVICVTGILIYLSSYDLNYLKPIIEKAAIDATGRKLTIQGDIYFHVGWPPGICITEIMMDNAQWSKKPHMLKVGKLEVDLEILPLLHKIVHVKQLTLNDFNLSVEINKKGKSNLNFETVQQKQAEKVHVSRDIDIPQLGFNQICLKNILLSYENANEPNQLSLTLNQINAKSNGMDAPVHMDIIGEYRNHQFDIQADAGSIHCLLNAQENFPLTITAQGAGMSLTALGNIQDVMAFKGVQLQMLCKGTQFKQFLEMTGMSMPLDGPYHFQLGLIEKQNKQYKSAVDISLGNNKLKGLGEILLNRQRPGIKLVFQADTIDFRPFISAKPRSKNISHPDTERLFSNQPLITGPLSKIDFIGMFNIQTLMTPRLAIHDIHTKVQLSPETIEIKPFTARIGGGKIAAQLKIKHASQIKIFTNILTQDMNVGQMLKELGISDMFDGVLDFRVHLATQGRSLNSWMSSLDGYVSVYMENGKLYNQYVNMLGGELSSNLIRLINPLKKNQYTHVNCMATRFDMTNGRANTTIMMLDTDQMRVIGNGHISLDNETIDISIRPLPKKGLDTGRLGKFSLSLSELAKPFKLGGTLKKPELKLDYNQAAWTIGKTIGGVVLFGPVGIAASLISGVADNKNPCEIAKTVVQTGKYPEGAHANKSMIQKTKDSVQQGINNVGKKIGDTFNKLWGSD
jgi:hypothetical protein